MKNMKQVAKSSAVVLLAVIAGLKVAAAQNTGTVFVPSISAVAGTGTAGAPGAANGDGGPATAGLLNQPYAAVYDLAGNILVVDNADNTIRRIDAVTGVISTFAGNGTVGVPATANGDGGPATSAQLNKPTGVVADAFGNVYINDAGDCTVRKVTAGIITTVVGTGLQTSGKCVVATGGPTYTTGVPASSFGIGVLGGIAVDAAGNVYVASSTRIYRYLPASSQVFVYACNGSNGRNITGDGGSATLAACGQPAGVTLDAQGNLYFSDSANSVVRKVAVNTLTITEVAGTFDNPGGLTTTPTPIVGNTGDGGQATAATLNVPRGVFVDAAGTTLYIASTTANSVRVVNLASGIINTFAGTGTSGSAGNGGPAPLATLGTPFGVSGTPAGDKILIADTKNNAIRLGSLGNVFPATAVRSSSAAQLISVQTTAAGSISSFGVPASNTDFVVGAPTGCPGTVVAGSPCTAPVTFTPTQPGLRTAPLAVVDGSGNQAILGLSGIGLAPAANFVPGLLNPYAGTGTAGSTGDGAAATAAQLNRPAGVAVDVSLNTYIADTNGNKVRRVNSATGVITVVAGTGTAGFGGDGAAATAALLSGPTGLALDAAGNLYIADSGNNRIRVVSAATGNISTLAGGTSAGSTGDGGLASAALLSNPQDVATDGLGNLYIADTGNNEVRVVNLAGGAINLVAGNPVAGTSPDGTVATAASLSAPAGVAVDSNNLVYISDSGNNLVRQISGGLINTVAGSGTAGNTGDGGSAKAAQLSNPGHLSVDAGGDLYVADTGNQRVREVSAASGIISAVAGTGIAGTSANGLLSNVSNLSAPRSVTVGPLGNLFIADTGNNRVVRVDTNSLTLTFPNQPRATTSATQTLALQNFGNRPLTLTNVVITPATFARLTGGPGDCTATTVLAAGGNCLLRVTFTPTAGGSVTGSLTITDNALNQTGATQVVNLSGVGLVVPATVTVQSGNNQTTPPLGTFAPLKVIVLDSGGVAANNASVTFTAPVSGVTGTFSNGSNTITVLTASDGTASATLSAGVNKGTFTVSATVPGVTTAATFTETIAGNVAPVLTLTVPAGSYTYGQSLTVTAKLTPSTVGSSVASGTVTVFSNGVQVGTGSVNAAGQATVTFSPNAGANSLTATYSGDSNFSTSTTLSPTVVNVAKLAITATTTSATVPYGTPVAAQTGTLTGVLPADAANVTVSFSPTVSQTFPDVGTYPYTALLSGSAAANYTATVTGTPTYTVVIAPTTTTITATPTQVFLGSAITFTAKVTSTVAGGPAPTGQVRFSSGALVLGTLTLTSANNGTISLSSTLLPAGAQTVTATYLGINDYATSTSATVAVTVTGPDFTFALTPAAASVAQGDRVYGTVTLTPNQVFTSTVTLSCINVPATFSCLFTPSTLTTAAPSTMFTIATSGETVAAIPVKTSAREIYFAAFFLPGLLLLAGVSRRFRSQVVRANVMRLCLLLGALTLLGGVSGCGTGVNEPRSPLGDTAITVQAVGGGVTHTATFTITVKPAVRTN